MDEDIAGDFSPTNRFSPSPRRLRAAILLQLKESARYPAAPLHPGLAKRAEAHARLIDNR